MSNVNTITSINRKGFILGNQEKIALTKKRKQYVVNQIKLIGYDVINLCEDDLLYVFKLLARIEEYSTKLKYNSHNWELDYSHGERLSQSTLPVIEILLNEWEEKGFVQKIANLNSVWPEGKEFALCLSHDMDILSGNVFWDRIRSLPSYLHSPLIQKLIVLASTLRAFYKRYLSFKRVPDPILVEWLEEENLYGFKSSLFFLAQPIPEPDWEDSFYRYNDKVMFGGKKYPINEIMKKISERGWDVGLHGSTKSHASSNLLKKERHIVEKACGKKVSTIRQHHLFYDIRYTPFYQNYAGFLADSSIGSNIRSSYRCGTGMPYYQYDIINDEELSILQIPLIIQDVALFRVLKMDEETAFNHCMQLIRKTAELGGMITLLWHNNYSKSDVEFKVYSRILKEASSLGAWGCSASQVQEHWANRKTQLL
jgi:hypothetical protein